MNIYIDIETIPAQDPSIKTIIAESVTAPGQYKKPESIKEWLDANREAVAEDEWKKTSFDGGLGQVCCISAAVDNDSVKTFFSQDWKSGEKQILSEFFSYMHESYDPSRKTPPIFIGHNVTDFDLRFIFQRAVVIGVRPPIFIPFSARPWDKSVFDTMTQWAGYGKRIGLEKLCNVLGIAGKGSEIDEPIDGSMVWDFVRDGKIEKVAAYCAGDVERVRAIHHRMTFTSAP